MAGDQDRAANEAFHTNQDLSNQQFELGRGALSGGLSYLTNARAAGGYDQSAKYSAMQSLTMDETARANPAARAQALAGVTAQKVTSGLDEMNKLRSMLSGQGLQTTNLAQQAAGQSVSALAGMYNGNQTAETIKGAGALAASGYGAGKQAGWWGQAPSAGAQAGYSYNPAMGKV